MGVEHGGSRILPSSGCWQGAHLHLGGQSQLYSSRSCLPWSPGLGTSYLPFPVPSGTPGAGTRKPVTSVAQTDPGLPPSPRGAGRDEPLFSTTTWLCRKT